MDEFVKAPRWKRVRRFEEPGKCGWCGSALTGRRSAWCTTECATASDRASGMYVRHDALRANRELHDGELRCAACGKRLYSPHSKEWKEGRENGAIPSWDDRHLIPEVDHIHPISLGGSLSELSNLQVLCHEDHAVKTAKDQGRIARAKHRARQKTPPLELHAESRVLAREG